MTSHRGDQWLRDCRRYSVRSPLHDGERLGQVVRQSCGDRDSHQLNNRTHSEQIQVHTNHSDFSGAQEYARVIRVIHSIISSACAYWAYAMAQAVVSDLQQRAEQLYH